MNISPSNTRAKSLIGQYYFSIQYWRWRKIVGVLNDEWVTEEVDCNGNIIGKMIQTPEKIDARWLADKPFPIRPGTARTPIPIKLAASRR